MKQPDSPWRSFFASYRGVGGIAWFIICFYFFANMSFDADNIDITEENDNDSKNAHHFWGPIDSTLDFCEPNYYITDYIAEFFNTLSSLPMALFAILGLILTRKYATKEFKYTFAFLCLGCVGLGSAAFHGTLRFHAQLFDELPMVFGTMSLAYCLVQTKEPPKGKPNYLLIFIMIAGTIIVTVLYVKYQFYHLFLMTYISLVFLTSILTIYDMEGIVVKLFVFTCLSYYGALSCWTIDLMYCKQFQTWQLHSFWHIGAGYGAFLWLMVAIAKRGQFLKKKIALNQSCESGGAHFIQFEDV